MAGICMCPRSAGNGTWHFSLARLLPYRLTLDLLSFRITSLPISQPQQASLQTTRKPSRPASHSLLAPSEIRGLAPLLIVPSRRHYESAVNYVDEHNTPPAVPPSYRRGLYHRTHRRMAAARSTDQPLTSKVRSGAICRKPRSPSGMFGPLARLNVLLWPERTSTPR